MSRRLLALALVAVVSMGVTGCSLRADRSDPATPSSETSTSTSETDVDLDAVLDSLDEADAALDDVDGSLSAGEQSEAQE